MNREFTLTPGAEFAPVRRSAFTEVKDDFKRICACELVAPILDAMGEPAALLNENRQVVFANTAMCELGGVVAREEILGLRLGEVLGCDLALNRPGGCGTYRECRIHLTDAYLELTNGREYRTEDGSLHFSSQDTSGWKVKISPAVVIGEGLASTLLLDFDLSKIFRPQPNDDPI